MPKHRCPEPQKNSYEWPCRVCHPGYYVTNPDIQWFLLHVIGDVMPALQGPYFTMYEMEKEARRLKEQVDDEDGIYWLTQDKGQLTTGSWNAGFFMKGQTDE